MTPKAPARPLAIDVTRLARVALRGRRPTGIDRVTMAYARHFAPHARALLGQGGWVVELGEALSARAFGWLADAPACERAGAQPPQGPRCLIHTGHSGLESMDYLSAVRRRGLLPVVLLHDLIPITHPHFSRPGIPERHVLRVRHACQAAAVLVCNSEATRQELASLCAERGWRMPPTVVAHLGVEPWARPRGGKPLVPVHARPYFVCIGTIEPRKNHLLLLRAWRALEARLGERTPDLLLLGQRGWLFDEVVHALRHDEVARRHVHERAHCSDAELRACLLGAQALLMPSQVEGFGLPVAEALACGTPVIASDLPVYREFAQEVPEYLGAQDEAAWAARIEAFCDPEGAARRAQLARLANWRPPSWASHFEVIESLLRELGERGAAA